MTAAEALLAIWEAEALRDIDRPCEECGYITRLDDDGLCSRCRRFWSTFAGWLGE